MADENDEGDELTEIIVNAPDSGGYGNNGGGGGGYVGGGFGGGDIWASWIDNFIFARFGNGPDEGGGGDSNGQDEPPEIVVNAPPPPSAPINDVDAALAAILNSFTYTGIGDWEGYYRINVLLNQNGDTEEVRVDLLNPETQNIDTYVMTTGSSFTYSKPDNEIPDFPDQSFRYSGPETAPEHWNWA